MLSISNIPPERRQPQGLDLVIPVLSRGLAAQGVDFVLVGAVARDVQLDAVLGNGPRRGTSDLDLAVLVSSEEKYTVLRAWLVEHEGFTAPSSSAFCLIHGPTGMVVDLMPFGGIADADGSVRVTGPGLTRISVAGVAEAVARPALLAVPEGPPWQVVSLPGLVVLKLLAWQDRPEQRGKDGSDLRLIVQHYGELADAELFDNHADLLDLPDDTGGYLTLAGAQLLGRQVQQVVASNAVLRERVTALLNQEATAGGDSRLAEAMRLSTGFTDKAPTLAWCVAVLGALRAGLLEEWVKD